MLCVVVNANIGDGILTYAVRASRTPRHIMHVLSTTHRRRCLLPSWLNSHYVNRTLFAFFALSLTSEPAVSHDAPNRAITASPDKHARAQPIKARRATEKVTEASPRGIGLPAPIALAATWDRALIEAVYADVGESLAVRGATQVAFPSINATRDPRFGRFEQGFGEDPWLVGELALAAVKGLNRARRSHGSDSTKPLFELAIGAYGGSAAPRRGVFTTLPPTSLRDLHENHLPPFQTVLKNAPVDVVWLSDSDIDALPMATNHTALAAFREHTSFAGPFWVDANADDLRRPLPLSALDMPRGHTRTDGKKGAAHRARPMQTTKYANAHKIRDDRLFNETIILLKKDDLALSNTSFSTDSYASTIVLDLAAPSDQVAISPVARSLRDAVTRAGAHGDQRDRRARLIARETIDHQLATASQLIIVADASAMASPAQHDAIIDSRIDRILRTGKPVAVVLTGDYPWAPAALIDRARIVIGAWGLSGNAAQAILQTLDGSLNPSGKLPFTIPRSEGQRPMYYNVKPSAFRGYLFEDSKPLFAFGEGLSYSRFQFGYPTLSNQSIKRDESFAIEIDIANIGDREGIETVQLYVRDKVSAVTRPVKELRGFERVSLKPGEQRTIKFRLPASALGYWNEQMQWTIEPGDFEIMLGPNSRTLQIATLTVREDSSP